MPHVVDCVHRDALIDARAPHASSMIQMIASTISTIIGEQHSRHIMRTHGQTMLGLASNPFHHG
jgi:hypothetical protein